MTTRAPHNPPEPSADQAPAADGNARVQFLTTIVCDVVLPIALYYILRGAGLSELVSLIISGSAPALHTLYSIAKNRKVDSIGIFTIVILLLGAAGSAISGSPRVVLARNGAFTGAAGLWMLVTMWISRPFTYRAVEALLPHKAQLLDRLWETEPVFRRAWRMLNALWGVGLLVDAVLRIIMAFSLPVDSVPAIDGVLYAVTWVILQIITQITLRRTGVFRMIFPDRAAARDARRGRVRGAV